MKSGKVGWQRIQYAIVYSIKGLQQAWGNEAAFRQELLACAVLVPAALWFGESGLEKAALIACCILVLIVEILNSALEAIVDRIGAEHHELSGRAKDMGSAAVFLSIGLVGTVWGLILFV